MSEAPGAVIYDHPKDKISFTREQLLAIQNNPNHTPEDVLGLLDLDFKHLLDKAAGVWEGYSVRRHESMAMAQFRKYYHSEKMPGNTIDVNDFELLLSLHDLRKPEDGRGKHEFTLETAKTVFEQLKYEPKQINLMLSLIEGDPIGYVIRSSDKDKYSKSAKEIIEKAKSAEIEVADYWKLLNIYYRADAGSYTQDAGGHRSLDHLFVFDPVRRTMSYSEKVQEQIDQLGKEIHKLYQAEPKQTIETNKGRKIEQDDILCFAERRGTDYFLKVLLEGRITSPRLIKDREKETKPLIIPGGNEIFTSLYGPYWQTSCVLVFNAWETLEDFDFYDQGHTGLKLYDKNYGTPAELRFTGVEKDDNRNFLILTPNRFIEKELRQKYIQNGGNEKFFNDHTLSSERVSEILKQKMRVLLEKNPDFVEGIKKLYRYYATTPGELGNTSESKQYAEIYLKLADGEGVSDDLINWSIHGLGEDEYDNLLEYFKDDRSSDNTSVGWFFDITHNFYDPWKCKELSQEFRREMQNWLKNEFSTRFKIEKNRKGSVQEKKDQDNKNDHKIRLSLTVK